MHVMRIYWIRRSFVEKEKAPYFGVERLSGPRQKDRNPKY